DDCALLDRIDGEARVLEAPQDTLPLPLDSGWIAIDEDERRAGGKRFPQSHPRLHSGCFGRRGDRPEKWLLSRFRRERSGDERQPRPCAQRRSQLEPWNEETRAHSNTTSIHTYVLLSTRFPVSVAMVMDWDWTRVVIDHVHIRVQDAAASVGFYRAVLEPLRITGVRATEQ